MQLDFLLKSIIAKFKFPEYKISVIYHTTGSHKEGYKKVKNKYKQFINISFLEREKQILTINSYFKTFYSLKNIWRFLLHSYLHNRNSDNFKSLLENLLKTTDCEYVMFNTDDGYFFDEVVIPKEILTLIKSNPLQTSFRLYVGDNLDGCPDYIRRENNYYIWNYYENSTFNHWTYPFSVDGTVYYTKCVLDIIKKVPYHNPITLEGYGVEFVREKKVFKTGLSPIKSCLLGTLLNRVSTCSYNPTINLNIGFLNSKFLDDYELEIKIPTKIINVNIVPENVYLIKENHKFSVYTFDQYGKEIQDAFGPEGTKHQLQK